MSRIPFSALPDEARLWTFHADHQLTDEEADRLHDRLDAFVTEWAAHRRDLTAGYDVLYNQFVVVGVDESKLPPSGCSIDAMVHALRGIGAELSAEFIDAPEIAFRDGEDVRCVSREEFERLAGEGEVTSDTIVFNRTVDRVGDLRGGRWELPARSSWHARAFPLRRQPADF